MKNNVLEKLFRWQYPFIMLASLGLAYFRRSSSGSIMPLLLIFWLFYGAYAFFHADKNKFKSLYTFLMVYVVLSVVQYAFNGAPFKYYYSDVRGLVIPMLMVFVGMINKDDRIYKWLVLSTVFCVVVGLFLYFVQPGWYLSFKVAALEDDLRYADGNLNELNVMALSTAGRFSSFFPTTYPVAYYTTFSLCISLNDMYKEQDNRLFKSNWMLLLVMGVLLVGIILTLTRVAIAYIVLLLVYYFIYGYIRRKKNRHLVRGLFIAIGVIVVFAFVRISNSDYGSLVLERMEGRLTLDATDELVEGSRADQTVIALSSWNNKLFGDGMGSKGGSARADGKPGITDDDWIRVLVEFGVVGTLLFLTVFGVSLMSAFKRRQYFMAEFTIVLYGVVSMLVADTMYKGHLVLIFWFAIGRIWNIQLFQDRLINNNKI